MNINSNYTLDLSPEDADILVRGGFGSVPLTANEEFYYSNLWQQLRDHAKLVLPPMGKDKVWTGGSLGLTKKLIL